MREYFGDNVDIVTDENRYSPIAQAKSGQVASVRECHTGAWSRALEMQAGLSSETSQNQRANPDDKVRTAIRLGVPRSSQSTK